MDSIANLLLLCNLQTNSMISTSEPKLSTQPNSLSWAFLNGIEHSFSQPNMIFSWTTLHRSTTQTQTKRDTLTLILSTSWSLSLILSIASTLSFRDLKKMMSPALGKTRILMRNQMSAMKEELWSSSTKQLLQFQLRATASGIAMPSLKLILCLVDSTSCPR